MTLMIKDMQLLKNYTKIWKKIIAKLMKIDVNTKTTYGDDDDIYIKTKIKTYKIVKLQLFIAKMSLRKYQKKKYTIKVYQH